MGNNLNINLIKRYVIASKKYCKGTDVERVFYCTGGFGCQPYTNGNCVGGYFVDEGISTRIEGWMIERIATKEEIRQAKENARKNNIEPPIQI